MNIRVVTNPIREYDMRSANISVLAEEGMISEEMFLDLLEAPKNIRNKLIGLAIRYDNENKDKVESTEITSEGLAKDIRELVSKYVKEFIKVNKIKQKNVVEIAHDAIFITGQAPKVFKFGEHILFRMKHKYSFMLEFPISENSSQNCKLYKTTKGVESRYGKINKDHSCYGLLVNLLHFRIQGNKSIYFKELKKFVSSMRKTKEELFTNIENEHILRVFQEMPFF